MATALQHFGGSTWTDPLSGNATLNIKAARVQVYAPTGATRTLEIDSATKYPTGADLCVVVNVGSETLAIRDADFGLVGGIAPNEAGKLTLFDNSTDAGVWRMKVKSVNSVVANLQGTYGYVFGDFSAGFPLEDVVAHDPQMDTATYLASASGAQFWNAAGSVIGSVGIISGSSQSGQEDECWEFDSNPVAFTAKQDRTTGYCRGAAATMDTTKHVTVGGRDTNAGPNAEEMLYFENGTPGTWTALTDCPYPRRHQAFTASSSDSAYMVGGETGGAGTVERDTYHFQESTDTWSTKPDLPLDRHESGAGLIGTDVLNVFGYGDDIDDPGNMRVWGLDISSETWSERTEATGLGLDYLYGFAHTVIDYLGEKFYTYGGDDDSPSGSVDNIYEMEPGVVMDTWTSRTTLPFTEDEIQRSGMTLGAHP